MTSPADNGLVACPDECGGFTTPEHAAEVAANIRAADKGPRLSEAEPQTGLAHAATADPMRSVAAEPVAEAPAEAVASDPDPDPQPEVTAPAGAVPPPLPNGFGAEVAVGNYHHLSYEENLNHYLVR